jgi:alkaline phosphatase D
MRIDHAGHGNQKMMGEIGGSVVHALNCNRRASPAQFGRKGRIPPRATGLFTGVANPLFSIAMTPSRPLFALFRVIALAMLLLANAVHAAMTVMHGFADYTSVLLWIQTDRSGPVAITVTPEAGGDGRLLTFEADAANDYALTARVPGLAPGARYRYRIVARDDVREGSFRTQVYWNRAADAPELTIAIGSCHYLANPNPVFRGSGGDYQIFDAIAAKRPDLMLWLGDNLYLQSPDFVDPSSMAARYRQVRSFAPMQPLLTATSHLAIVDDHDIGPNDVDGSYVLKGESLKLFQRYWPNPSYGLPGVAGAFGWARLGDVEFFLLDDRYYRFPNHYPDVPEKTMFGAAQFEWLKQALLSSRARIKIVAGGSQFWNRASRFEGLYQFPQEQQRLSDWLLRQKIDGVVFVSGDRHFGELLKIERAGAYPLYEYTSSPLTSGAVVNIDASERNNPDVVPGTLQGKRQFGLIRVSGPGTDRKVALEAYDSDGALLWRHEINANDLRFPR